MYKIGLSIRKGGTAKTVTSINLAWWLADKGYKVLFIDMDTQASASSTMSVRPDTDENSTLALIEGKAVAPVHTKKAGLDLIPSTWNLLAVKSASGSATRLSKALERFESQYDFCILDCPPGHTELEFNAMQAIDGVVMPMKPDMYDYNAFRQSLDTVELFKATNHSLSVLGVILTMYEPRYVVVKEITEALTKELNSRSIPLLGTVRKSVKVPESLISCQSLFEYAPTATITNDCKQVFENILKEVKRCKKQNV